MLLENLTVSGTLNEVISSDSPTDALTKHNIN